MAQPMSESREGSPVESRKPQSSEWIALTTLAALVFLFASLPILTFGELEITLVDLPTLLILFWFRLPRALLTLALGALLALVVWGHQEFFAWTALFLPLFGELLVIHFLRSRFKGVGFGLSALLYLCFLATPTIFVVFSAHYGEADAAVVATGQRLFSGMLSVALALLTHLSVLFLQKNFTAGFFTSHERFQVSMREVSETAALVTASIPLLALVWFGIAVRLDADIQKLFAASDARFESLAQSAASSLLTQNRELKMVRDLVFNPDSAGAEALVQAEQLGLKILSVENAIGFLAVAPDKVDILLTPQLEPYRDGLTLDLDSLRNSNEVSTLPLTEDPEGLVGYTLSNEHGLFLVVFESPHALWNSLYDSDMLGMMGGHSVGGMIDRVSHFHGPSTQQLYGIAEEAVVVRSEYDYAMWIPPARNAYTETVFQRVGQYRNSYITFQASDQLIDSFDRGLYDVDCFRYTVDFWSYAGGTLKELSYWVYFVSLLLCVMAVFIEYAVARFTTQFLQLSDAMSKFSVASLSGNFEMYRFDKRGGTEEFRVLRQGFSEMEAEIHRSASQLVALNASYEALLNATDLGFLAIDSSNNVVYLNRAMERFDEHAPGLIEEVTALPNPASGVVSHAYFAGGLQFEYVLNYAARQDMDGNDDGRWLIIADLTSHKQTERELLQAQRMSHLGQLATGMAHEINQPLQAIRLAIANQERALTRTPPNTERATEKAEVIKTNVYRIANLIGHMKMHGAVDSVQSIVFAANTEISSVLADWQGLQDNPNLEVTLNLAADEDTRVKGDPERFGQVIQHLLSNFRDAALRNPTDKAHLTIETRRTDNNVILTATDDAGGFDGDTLASIFDPFFTTKDPDKGTGLGLSVSYGIISQMGGAIHAEAVPRGARFVICVPANA